MLKPFTEIMLSFGNAKEAVVFPIGATKDCLDDMTENGITDGNKTLYFKFDQHDLQYEDGIYDVTVDVFKDGKSVLYNLKDAEIESVGADTVKITV